MQLSIATKQPFSFAQTLAFIRRFPPCQGEYLVTDDSVSAAVSVAGIARVFTLRAGLTEGAPLRIDLPRHVDGATQWALLGHAADFVGAGDDLAPLYAAAEGDPPFRALVAELYGLHHVRFLTLEEIAVYCVLMQRTPVGIASLYKRRFLDRFGIPVDAGGQILRAMPELAQLVELDASEIGDAICHARKAEMIVDVVRGVAAIGERFLREAPYAAARDALLAIPGIGPFSATAILLRGLGRMDELPVIERFEAEARALYGNAYDPVAIANRYGAHIGYWAHYVKVGAARRRQRGPALAPQRVPARSARARGAAVLGA